MARRTRQVPVTKTVETKKIKRQDLIDALTKVKPGLSNKEIVEQSTHFIFDNDKIWTYNDRITITQKFDSGLSGAVKAEQFYKLLQKLPDEEIEVTTEPGKINIEGKKRKINIKIDPDVKITPLSIPGINSQKWEELPENFHTAIAFASFAASRNMIRPELCCLFVADGYVIGCDTFRGTKYKLTSKLNQNFLLPAEAARELSKYNPHKVLIDSGWLHFVNKENTVFSCRTISDIDYPEQIWEFFNIDGEEIMLPEDFLNAIDRAQALVTADFDLDRIVTLTMENNEIICESKGDYGDYTEKADIEYNGEKLEIKVHPVLLKEILKHLQKMVVGSRLLFVGEEFEHGICLSC